MPVTGTSRHRACHPELTSAPPRDARTIASVANRCTWPRVWHTPALLRASSA